MEQQIRVAAIVRSGDFVLIHRSTEDDFWALPGGKLELGETTMEGMTREIREELDLEVGTVSLAGIIETRFEYQGGDVQQVGFYFHVDVDLAPTEPFQRSDGDVELEFRWVRADELSSLDLRPTAVAELVRSPSDPVVHLFSYDKAGMHPA